MTINVMFQNENSSFDTDFNSSQIQNEVDFKNSDNTIEFIHSNNNGTSDYRMLINKPTINSIVLEGAMTASDLGLGSIYYDTKEHWNSQMSLIAEEGAIYIYSDYGRTIDPSGHITPVAGMKIGDGTSYLIDLPFISDTSSAALARHITNTSIHVSAQEKEFWNHKVSSYLAGENDLENLVLSKTNYVTEGDIYHG